MARTTKDDVLHPELFTDAVQGAFAQRNALMGSTLASIGAAVIDGNFPGSGPNVIATQVEMPYFGTLGDFVNNPDGTAITPSKIAQTSEFATVSRDSLGFEVTRWGASAKGGDAYQEAARQIVVAAQRAIDKRCIDAAVAAGGLTKDVYSSSTPRTLDYDLMVDAKTMWGDEQDDMVGMVVHSQTMASLLRLRDGNGVPFLTQMVDGSLPRFMGMPVAVSDRLPTTGSSMSSVTSSGTSPPAVTLSGTPNGPMSLQIDIVVGGTLGVATFRFSTDGGQNWSATLPTAASVPLIDTAIDSLVGVNGATGITAAFAAGTYNADNLYAANAILKVRSLLLKRAALGFWYNRSALTLRTDDDILMDSAVGAMHLYAAAHRYRRRPGGTKSGVVVIAHNVG